MLFRRTCCDAVGPEARAINSSQSVVGQSLTRAGPGQASVGCGARSTRAWRLGAKTEVASEYAVALSSGLNWQSPMRRSRCDPVAYAALYTSLPVYLAQDFFVSSF